MIRQVGKGAVDRICRGVTDRIEHSASSKSLVRHGIEIKLRAALDCHSLCFYLVGSAMLCIELVGVGAVGLKAERVLAGQYGRLVGSNTRRQESAAATASTDTDRSGDDAFAS